MEAQEQEEEAEEEEEGRMRHGKNEEMDEQTHISATTHIALNKKKEKQNAHTRAHHRYYTHIRTRVSAMPDENRLSTPLDRKGSALSN